jgi:putative membrane protein
MSRSPAFALGDGGGLSSPRRGWKRGCLVAGVVVLAVAWLVAAADYGMTGHMAAHMAAVSLAAPLLAVALTGTGWDPAARWPRLVTPLAMSLLELAVVWGWHLPAVRAWVAADGPGLLLEQAMFLSAGLVLWSACLGTLDADSSARRASGVAAMLLTTMHMTLLGVLVTLAPRTLFGTTGFTCLGVDVAPLVDQQLGGVVMLLAGGVSYLAGGLLLLSRLLRQSPAGQTVPGARASPP